VCNATQPILHPPKPLYKPAFQPVYPPETAITASNPQLYYLKDEEIDLATFLKNAHTTPAKATVGGEAGVRWKSHWLAVEGVQPLIKENPISQISRSHAGSALSRPGRYSSHLRRRQTVHRGSDRFQAIVRPTHTYRGRDLGQVASLSRIPAPLSTTHRGSRTRPSACFNIRRTIHTECGNPSQLCWTFPTTPFSRRSEPSHALGIREDP
jgi:hypothetical protein